MAAPVRLEAKAFTDWRYPALAKSFDYPEAWGLGIMAMVYSHCTTERKHSLSRKALDAIARLDGFADAVVASELGDMQDDGTIRIRGTEGRIEWLDERREAARRGGVASAEAKRSKRQAFATVCLNNESTKVNPLSLSLSPPIETKAHVEVLDFLNSESGRGFKPVESNLEPIRARLAEGHTVDDIKLAIRFKVKEWQGTDMDKFIRPETLFRASKFQGYVESAKAAARASKPPPPQPTPGIRMLTPEERAEMQALRDGGGK